MINQNEVIEVKQHPELECTYTVTSPSSPSIVVNHPKSEPSQIKEEATASGSHG
jgi:hypothetical protein